MENSTSKVALGARASAWADQFLTNSPEHLATPPQALIDCLAAYIVASALAGPEVASASVSGVSAEFDFLREVARLRLKLYGAQFDESTVAFIALVSNTPGDVVMWAAAAARFSALRGKTASPTALIIHFGKTGLPSPKRVKAMWDMQKMGGANLLDMVGEGSFN